MSEVVLYSLSCLPPRLCSNTNSRSAKELAKYLGSSDAPCLIDECLDYVL